MHQDKKQNTGFSVRKFYTDGHSRLVKWRPSFSCPLRNCLLLRRSDWCCHCWIQNHGSMLGSSYRLQIPVLQWRITPEMCQKNEDGFARELIFCRWFSMIILFKIGDVQIRSFPWCVWNLFNNFCIKESFIVKALKLFSMWSSTTLQKVLRPHTSIRLLIFFSFCFHRWFQQFCPCPFHEVCFTNGSNIWKQTGFMYILWSFADLGAEVHGVNIFGTAGLQLPSIAITSSATATTQITQAGHWRVERVVAASQSQPGRLRKYCECQRPHVFWLDCGMPVLLG